MSREELKRFCHHGGAPVYIYGAGGYGRLVKAFLEECNIDVAGFVVSQKDDKTRRVMGIPLLGLSEVDETGNFIVGVGKAYEKEIIQKLLSIGIEDYFLLDDGLMDELYHSISFEMPKNLSRNYANILLYHRVARGGADPWGLKVTPEHFDTHIRYIKEHYHIMRFEDDWSDVREPFVVITFDDGYLDNYEVALPILEKYQVPATIFVSTECIGNDDLLWWDCLERMVMHSSSFPKFVELEGEHFVLSGGIEDDKVALLQSVRDKLKMLLPGERKKILKILKGEVQEIDYAGGEDRVITREELKRLADSPWITIGGHTVTHSMLSVESEDMQRWEFMESKHYLEEVIGCPVTVMSYPFGSRKDISEFTPNIAKSCGYRKAAVNWQGTCDVTTDPFRLPRNSQRDCEMEEFARMLRGTWYMYGD